MTFSIRKPAAVAAAAAWLTLLISGCTGGVDAPNFSGENAFKLLKRQCDFGPRPLGSDAHGKTGDYLASVLTQYADKTFEQRFTHKAGGRTLAGRNILGVFGENRKRWVLLLAHWDTRPVADEEVDSERAGRPIIGANDGASGCAVLLELARLLHDKRAPVGVVVMLVDGEDYGSSPDEMFLGSKAFAERWREVMRPVKSFSKFEYGILLDMVGDKDLQIHKEQSSAQAAPRIVSKVWSSANDLGYRKFFLSDAKYWVQDDHQPLLVGGIKCIDVIDFDYAYWHTLEDTVDKCSPRSLKIVGDVIARTIYSEPDAQPTR